MSEPLDIVVVGAGPCGIAVGAAAAQLVGLPQHAGREVLAEVGVDHLDEGEVAADEEVAAADEERVRHRPRGRGARDSAYASWEGGLFIRSPPCGRH